VILHGICYDFFFVTGQIYVDGKAGAKIRSQAQGFYVLITQGLGMLIGAQIASWLVMNYTEGTGVDAVVDWQTVWMYPAGFAAVVLIAFVLLFKDKRIEPSTGTEIPVPTPGGPKDMPI
jgi:MFS family permease